jgi:hypothetical protein
VRRIIVGDPAFEKAYGNLWHVFGPPFGHWPGSSSSAIRSQNGAILVNLIEVICEGYVISVTKGTEPPRWVFDGVAVLDRTRVAAARTTCVGRAEAGSDIAADADNPYAHSQYMITLAMIVHCCWRVFNSDQHFPIPFPSHAAIC